MSSKSKLDKNNPNLTVIEMYSLASVRSLSMRLRFTKLLNILFEFKALTSEYLPPLLTDDVKRQHEIAYWMRLGGSTALNCSMALSECSTKYRRNDTKMFYAAIGRTITEQTLKTGTTVASNSLKKNILKSLKKNGNDTHMMVSSACNF